LLLWGFACVSGEVLSGEEAAVVLGTHNNLRRSTDPQAANMNKLQWSVTLANLADAWVENCDKGNNRFLNLGRSSKEKLGQNNWYDDAEVYASSPAVIVEEWVKRKDSYLFKERRCPQSVPFKECADFTQVVMAVTKFIGCARNLCDDGKKYLVTCLYEQGGNLLFKTPYKAGQPCSKCPRGYTCDDKLCVPPEESERELIETLLELL